MLLTFTSIEVAGKLNSLFLSSTISSQFLLRVFISIWNLVYNVFTLEITICTDITPISNFVRQLINMVC